MNDRELLKPLIDQLLALAERPDQEPKKQLWARFNALQPVDKVPVCITFEGIPAPQWDLLFGPDHLQCKTELARRIEFDLKTRVWMARNVPDDHVVWPAILVSATQAAPPDWGVPLHWRPSNDPLGAKEIVAPFADRINLEKLRHPRTEIDEPATQDRLAQAAELVEHRLAVHPRYPTLGEAVFDDAVRLRGMEQIFLDLIDRPQLIHELMRFITDSVVADHQRRQDRGWINAPPDPTGRYQMVPVFRHIAAYLPPDFADRKPLLRDEWAYVTAQTSAGLGPEMYARFVHQYNCRLAELFTAGTVYYHGCEQLDQKLDSIARLPNLRRHHVSPWSSVELAAEKFAGSVLLEVHAHPTEVFFGAEADDMRREIERLLKSAAGHPLCLNLSDIHSLGGNPHTLRTWAQIAQDTVENYP